jgi:hypothetical protein
MAISNNDLTITTATMTTISNDITHNDTMKMKRMTQTGIYTI